MAGLPNAKLSCFNQHEEILIQPEEILIQPEEMSFMQLFQDILNRIMQLKQVPEKSVEEAIERAKEGFKRYESPDFSQWDNLCAYLYRYVSHGAGLTREKVFDAVKNSDCLESSRNKKHLNVISLGGGPGNDAIGFCSALFDCGFKNVFFDITVIDKYKNWSECVTLAEECIKQGNFGNVTKLFQQNAHMSFSQVDLPPDSTNDDYYKLLQNADIILMVKLISILHLDPAEMLIKELHENVKKEAVILYIDTPNRYLDVIWQKKFTVLYSSKDDSTYCSSAGAPERFYSDDRVESGARIVVFRKRDLC